MIISVIEPLGISKSQFEELKKEFTQKGHTFLYYMDRVEDEASVAQRMREADIVVVSNIRIPLSILSQCPRLKMISVAFTGLDHIDMNYCQSHNILVKNAAGYSTTAVSELAVGLMLDLMRQVTHLDGTIRKGEGRGTFLGRELKGKTVGIVGTGAIGTATIRLLKAFGCHVIAYNRSRHPEVEALDVRYCSLEELLKESDIVSLHTPLNQDTHHLIGADQLAMMKPTALLINTARGNVADIPAVAQALKEGKIAGAAFDVFETEPPLATDHPLLQAPNAICVPHIAFATREAFDIRANIVMNNVRAFLKI